MNKCIVLYKLNWFQVKVVYTIATVVIAFAVPAKALINASIKKQCIEFYGQLPKSSSIQNYMALKHKTIINDYRTPDGNSVESCANIAWEIAEILIAKGERPTIISFKGSPLKPLIYEGRVTWGGHVVTMSNGLVYDPMLGESVAIEYYSQIAFGQELSWKPAFSGDTTEYINRYNRRDRNQ